MRAYFNAIPLLGWVFFCSSVYAGVELKYKKITMRDGVQLGAVIAIPTGMQAPYPLVLMPSSWGSVQSQSLMLARKWANEQGYAVVAYTPRGFTDSGGLIDVAGKDTIADVSDVITWAGRNMTVDTNRVGITGVSYGGGISLLAAAEDSRVKAIVPMSGWSDLKASLYPNSTISVQTVETLLLIGKGTGRPGVEMSYADKSYRAGNIQPALDMAPVRSPAAVASKINRNNPAILLMHNWNDGIFPASQMLSFYSQLTTPKGIYFAVGDHATAEMVGLAGMSNTQTTAALDWFNYYLKGVKNQVPSNASVSVQSQNTKKWYKRSSMPLYSSVETLHLRHSVGSGLFASGTMQNQPNTTTWSTSINTGVETVAESGVLFVTGLLPQLGVTPSIYSSSISRSNAAVWKGDVLTSNKVLSGSPRLNITVTPTNNKVSLFAYLYEEDASGKAKLITHKPYSLTDALPNKPYELSFELEPVVWELTKGNRLVLVVDTMDVRYKSLSVKANKVSLGTSSTKVASMDIPYF